MKAEQTQVIFECAQGSIAGQLKFPEVVSRLAAIGVERYHVDYCRQEITYYLIDGDSHVIAAPHELSTVAMDFAPSAVEAAVRQSQRNEHTYSDFVRKTIKAGCVGYFVQITGRRAIYFGRNGDTHVENFPAPASEQHEVRLRMGSN